MRFGILLLWAAAVLQAQPARILIITGQADLPHHHWQETTASLRTILSDTAVFDVRVQEEPRAITKESLQGYDAVVVNYNGSRFPASAEKALEQYVRAGGGLVSFHHASYGTFLGMQLDAKNHWHNGPGKGWIEWSRMIGATWDAEKLGHARRGIFTVDWKQPGHPIAKGLPASWVANDELYHRLTFLPGVEVLADALSPKETGGTGNREPVVWTNQYGKGRVLFTVLGHDAMAFYQPGTINMMARGVEWAARGKVTQSSINPHHAKQGQTRVLVVTSGHWYPTEFYAMLDSLPGVTWTHAPTHAEAFSKPLEDRYDVVILHDMLNVTTERARERLRAFVEAGKGVIELHHAIVDYSDWPWWYEEVVGGKYNQKEGPGHKASHYKEDVEFLVTPVKGKERHPVLKGVGPLWVYDECYKDMFLSPKIEVLMESADPLNDGPIVYVGPHPKARVLYIQLGHSAHTMNHPGFRKLMANAVAWAGEKR
jgi:type 1 glutamine amidotransferase